MRITNSAPSVAIVDPDVTLWITDDLPVRMFYAGERWIVTDTPTRLRESIWYADEPPQHGLYGWRFQGTTATGTSLMFDVFRTIHGWQIAHIYS